jgi:hypothetical protein
MASSFDVTNIPGMTKEMRDRVGAAFDALSNWRDEIEIANERCLGKVLDQTSAVARSMGWPEEAIKTTQDYLKRTSKAQTQLIDQLMEGWKHQLKSPVAPMGIPRLGGPISGPYATTMTGAMSDLNAFAPWTIWLHAVELWQRTWIPGSQTRSH